MIGNTIKISSVTGEADAEADLQKSPQKNATLHKDKLRPSEPLKAVEMETG